MRNHTQPDGDQAGHDEESAQYRHAADTVVLFLIENPAAVVTLLRQVTGIAHLLPSPTEHPAVKQWLRLAAGPDPAGQSKRIAELLRQIPATGWPAGLFGHRDRLLLAARDTAHLTPRLAALTNDHVVVDPERLTITLDTAPVVLPARARSRPDVRRMSLGDLKFSTVTVLGAVLSLADLPPSTAKGAAITA